MFLMQMSAQRRSCDFSERSLICSVNLNTSNKTLPYNFFLFSERSLICSVNLNTSNKTLPYNFFLNLHFSSIHFLLFFFHLSYVLLYALKYGISISFKNEMERSI